MTKDKRCSECGVQRHDSWPGKQWDDQLCQGCWETQQWEDTGDTDLFAVTAEAGDLVRRDHLAKKRGLLVLAILPNHHGYRFYGFAANFARYDCHVERGEDGIHRIAGEATYHDLIGWKPIGLEAPND
jgi:hypothetical protein